MNGHHLARRRFLEQLSLSWGLQPICLARYSYSVGRAVQQSPRIHASKPRPRQPVRRVCLTCGQRSPPAVVVVSDPFAILRGRPSAAMSCPSCGQAGAASQQPPPVLERNRSGRFIDGPRTPQEGIPRGQLILGNPLLNSCSTKTVPQRSSSSQLDTSAKVTSRERDSQRVQKVRKPLQTSNANGQGNRS